MERLNGELRDISSRLLKMQDEEHRRIARELHDGLGQELAALKMTIAQIPRHNSANAKDQAASEASEIVERASRQVRSMSHLLHPPLLDEVGLVSAIEWYLDGLTKRSGIATSLEVQPVNFPRLTCDVETAIFRAIQEALTNVFRHSGASNAWVRLSQQEGQVMVRVGDDGKGVDPEIAEMRPGSLGIGLAGMRQRAKEFGGTLRLTNANPGTLIEIVIPARSFVPQKEHAIA
jgi:signal transduction histidine kinase